MSPTAGDTGSLAMVCARVGVRERACVGAAAERRVRRLEVPKSPHARCVLDTSRRRTRLEVPKSPHARCVLVAYEVNDQLGIVAGACGVL